MSTDKPTLMKAYIHYGIVGSNILLISCYHSGRMDSLLFYAEYAQRFGKGAMKNSEKKFTQAPIADSNKYEVIKNAISEKLDEIKAALKNSNQTFNEVYFYADVNLCFSDKSKLAEFLMDNTLATIFAVPVTCVLETTLIDVAIQAATKHHEKKYQSKVTIKTKQAGSDGKFSYSYDGDQYQVVIDDTPISIEIFTTVSKLSLPINKFSLCELINTSNLDIPFPLEKKSLSANMEDDEIPKCPREMYFEKQDEVNYEAGSQKETRPIDEISSKTLDVGQEIIKISKLTRKLEADAENALKEIKKRRCLEEGLQKGDDALGGNVSASNYFRND
ncbi:Uncharacterised protein [Legionella busanensis]|uniref:Uncharacterized protein n=1 Tax=Legionella busanensis TaxID=190655 RepID=A0A378JM46_9GAMM|nr:hypothetical protein [Legionella busanensis]STX52416.1 Uncharacterised protein [Legionella busanensis]